MLWHNFPATTSTTAAAIVHQDVKSKLCQSGAGEFDFPLKYEMMNICEQPSLKINHWFHKCFIDRKAIYS